MKHSPYKLSSFRVAPSQLWSHSYLPEGSIVVCRHSPQGQEQAWWMEWEPTVYASCLSFQGPLFSNSSMQFCMTIPSLWLPGNHSSLGPCTKLPLRPNNMTRAVYEEHGNLPPKPWLFSKTLPINTSIVLDPNWTSNFRLQVNMGSYEPKTQKCVCHRHSIWKA